MSKRKGLDQAWLRLVQTAEQNKESVITISVLLYAGFYLLAGIGGISFQIQPALGYIQASPNSNCPGGSMWVEGNNLHWCDGSEEYSATDQSNDQIAQVGSVSGPNGAIWIEGSTFRWIDQNGVEYYHTGGDTGDNPSASNGAAWVEDGRVHYIDENGNERIFREYWKEGFESYSDGTNPSNMDGWSAGSDCGTCRVESSRSEDGSMSFYADVSSGGNWQEVLMKDISSKRIKHEAMVVVEYWESSSNHDGDLWVRSCDGTNIAGIGTDNPQFEWVTNSNTGSTGGNADYQDWTRVQMDIDLDANTVDFLFQQDGGESWNVDGRSIPSGKNICTIGIGPDAVWYIDDFEMYGY